MPALHESRSFDFGHDVHRASVRVDSGNLTRDRRSVMSGFHAIVPAGGAGTRLWPLSRAERPKFLLDLTGAGRSLLQQTWDRLVPLTGPGHVHVVTGRAHADAVAAQLPQARVLAEPSARDSMPAIGLAVAL